MSVEKKNDLYEKISAKERNQAGTKYVSCYNDIYKDISKEFDAGLMNELILHKFEDTELYIPKLFDNYLTKMYGDYMTPPPKEERIPIHMGCE